MNALSVLPLEFVIVLTDSMWYLASLNLLKILWIRTIIIYSRKLYHVRMISLSRFGGIDFIHIDNLKKFQVYRINFHLYKIAEIGIVIIVGVHWAACMEYYLPLVVAKIAGQNDLLSNRYNFSISYFLDKKFEFTKSLFFFSVNKNGTIRH